MSFTFSFYFCSHNDDSTIQAEVYQKEKKKTTGRRLHNCGNTTEATTLQQFIKNFTLFCIPSIQ